MNTKLLVLSILLISSLFVMTSCQGQIDLEGIAEGEGLGSDLDLDLDIDTSVLTGEGNNNNGGIMGQINTFVNQNWQIMFLVALLLLVIITVKK